MRILDVNNSYSPVGGGIRIYEHRKMEYFSASGEHSFALAAPFADPGKERRGLATIYRCDSLPLLDSGYRMTFSSGPVLSAVNDFAPDIIEIGSPWVMPSLVCRITGAAGIPTVGFFHTDYTESYIRPLVEKLFPPRTSQKMVELAERHLYRNYSRMDAVFCASRNLLTRLHGIGLRRLFHTPLGVDGEIFSPSRRSPGFRERLGVGGGRKLVLFLARLHREKGIDLLMEAYPRFRDPSSIVLAIGGHGPAEGRVGQFIARFPEVRRLGYLEGREAAAEAMASADAYLSLGPVETFGLAGLEAISSGTVTVFPDIGAGAEMAAFAEVLPPFVHGSADALADRILEALRLDRDRVSPELRSRAMDGMDWHSVFAREEIFYWRILEAHQRNDPESLLPSGMWWED